MDRIAVADATLSASALGAGPALALVHGLVFGNMASWYFPIGLPLAASRQVIVYDQRGHGDSSMVERGFDLATQADDLALVLKHYGAERVDLCGHSVGALIALEFALRQPQRVRRLILVDAPAPAARHVAPSLNAVTSQAAVADFVNEQLAHLGQLTPRRRERLMQRLIRLLFETSLVADVNAMGLPDAVALAGLKLPVQLIYGRHSPCRAAGDWLLERLPQASLIELEAGHYLPEEAPAPLLACMERFLTAGGQDDGQE